MLTPSLTDGHSLQNETFPFELFENSQSAEGCGIFDPVSDDWSLIRCDSLNAAVCQLQKGK